MAIKIYEQFAPFANPADGDYPYGSIKNDSIPGAEDGTPLDAEWGNDLVGFTDALLAEAGIVPNGQPDKLGASQRVDAIKQLEKSANRVTKNGGGNLQNFIDATSTAISTLSDIVIVADQTEIPSVSIPGLNSIASSVENKHFNISPTINGLESTPDTIKMLDSRYANRVGGFKPQRLGEFKTSPNLGHIVGDIKYTKHSQTHAEITTDLSKYIPFNMQSVGSPGVTVGYVDWTKTDNLGDGFSWANAKASLAAGLMLNTDILLVRSGIYNRSNRFGDFSVTKDLAVIAVGGPVTCGVVASGTWSKTSGQTNVYQLDYASGLTNVTSHVHDKARLNDNLAPRGYQPVASVAAVESLEGSFFHTATTTYVHAIGSRNLVECGDELVLIQPVNNSLITFTGNFKLYFEGIENWGGSGQGVTLASNGSDYPYSVFYNKDCAFNAVSGGASNGLSVTDIGLCISENSESSANRRDGFNYHNYLGGVAPTVGLAPHFIEINCRAHGNGLLGTEGNNQGSTAHEDSVGFRINGDYSGHPDGGCIVDIQGVKCYNVCCKTSGSSVAGQSLSADGYDRGSGIKTAEWWIDGAHCRDNAPMGAGAGDIVTDGYFAKIHMQDTDTEKPISTRSFTMIVDEDFS